MTAPHIILTQAAALERLALSVRHRTNRERLLAAAARLRKLARQAIAALPAAT